MVMSVSARIGKSYVLMSINISTAIILLILTFLLINSWQAIIEIGWGVFSGEWHPAAGKFGIMAMIYGSVAVMIIALIIAIPLGIMTAVFTSEVLPAKYRFYVKSMLELLAGIPSIIYGLIGIVFLSVWIEDFFALQSGRTILAGGILLAIMVLPTVITLSDDALHNVPAKYREAARGLGLYPYEVLKSAVFPHAINDITGALLLALGRVLGETMAVMLVIGSIDRIPVPFLNTLLPGQTITSKLGREIAETAFGSLEFSALIFMGLLLLVFVLAFTILAQTFFYQPEQRLYE